MRYCISLNSDVIDFNVLMKEENTVKQAKTQPWL